MANNMDRDPCLVCSQQDAENLYANFDGFHQKCSRCGEFNITGTALAIIGRGIGIEKRTKLSGWILDQNRIGSIPTIAGNNLQQIINRPLPSASERANRMLIEATHGQNSLRIRFDVNEPRFLAATYSSNQDDIYFLQGALADRGLIENVAIGGIANISADGLFLVDELKQTQTASSQGFIAMWFDEQLNEIYTEGFQNAVLNAGYDPVRIDRIEHINRIDDEIIAQINASRFVIADFTGHRGGVYFEAGYAMGLDIPIFWTCRSDDIDDLHFDIRQFNCIDWDSSEDLRTRLQNRIEAVIGPGPKKSQEM